VVIRLDNYVYGGVPAPVKKLVWLLALALLMCFARAEWSAELSADGRSLNVRFVNDTGAAVRNVKIICAGEVLGEIPGPVKPGDSAKVKLNYTQGESALSRLSVTYEVEETLKPSGAKAVSVNMYIRMPSRAFSKGETVPAYIVVENTGSIDAEDLKLTASNGFSKEGVCVKAGGYAEICFPVKVSFPFSLTAKALINGDTVAECSASEAEEEKVDVVITCATEAEISAGDTPKVSITLENRGNTDYTSPVLTASGFGAVAGLPGIIRAGETVNIETVLPALYEDAALSFRFEAIRADGRQGACSSPVYNIKVIGSAAPFEGRELKSGKADSSDLLLTIVTLGGLPQIALYVCAGLSALFTGVMVCRNARRRKKH